MKPYAVVLAAPVIFVSFGTQAVSAQTVPPAHHYVPEVQMLVRTQRPELVTVRSGDTLVALAKRYYGSAGSWPALWWANRTEVPDPGLIHPGQKLRVGRWHMVRPWLWRQVRDLAKPRAVLVSFQPYGPDTSPPQSSGQGCGLSGNLSYSQLEQLWVCADGPVWAGSAAATVAECESGGQQYAANPSGADGYWQILGQVVGGNIFDPLTNALNAVAKFEASGDTWAQWTCQP